MIHAYRRRQLSAYLDGSLPARSRARLEQHLADCAHCRQELLELRGTVALLRQMEPDEPPADLLDRVLAQIPAVPAQRSAFDRLREAISSFESPGHLLGSRWTPAFASVAVLVVAAALLRVEVDVRLPFGRTAPDELAAVERAPFQLEPPAARLAEASPLEPVSEVARVSQPLDASRRFDSISLWNASGLRRACLASPNDVQCHRFHQEMVVLALEDTPAFLDEVASVPLAPREQLLRVLSSEAERAGNSARIVSRLRAIPDPRAVGIVVRFERPAPPRD